MKPLSLIDQAVTRRWATEDPAADPAAEAAQDADNDGVSDETEAWLGTSNLTDETGVDGRTDAGYQARSDMDREQRADATFARFADASDDDTDVSLRVLQRGPRTLEGSPLGVRLSQLSSREE